MRKTGCCPAESETSSESFGLVGDACYKQVIPTGFTYNLEHWLWNGIRERSALGATLVILACTAASCGPEKNENTVMGPHCAFADPECTTLLGICEIVAQYYLAHHQWPDSKPQLEEQWKIILEREKAKMPAEESKELAGFFERFTLIDLRKQGENLRCHFRFKVENKSSDYKFTLRPGSTAEEIISTSTE